MFRPKSCDRRKFWPKFHQKSLFPRDLGELGFTLIEVLVVLFLMITVISMMAPRLQSQKTHAQEMLRKLTVIPRELHQSARLRRKNYRLAIKMHEKEGTSFWVESTVDQVLLKTQEQKEDDERKKSYITKDKDEPAPPLSGFQQDLTIMKTPRRIKLPLKIESVEVATDKEPVTEGMAYVHFFAQGLSEEAMIHLSTGPNSKWSIWIHALTGQAEIFTKSLSLADVGQK